MAGPDTVNQRRGGTPGLLAKSSPAHKPDPQLNALSAAT